MMRVLLAIVGIVAIAFAAAISLGLVQVEQTRKASLPSVAVKGGEAPAFKAQVADVSINTTEQTVELPTVSMTKTRIAMPTLKVDRPAGKSVAAANDNAKSETTGAR